MFKRLAIWWIFKSSLDEEKETLRKLVYTHTHTACQREPCSWGFTDISRYININVTYEAVGGFGSESLLLVQELISQPVPGAKHQLWWMDANIAVETNATVSQAPVRDHEYAFCVSLWNVMLLCDEKRSLGLFAASADFLINDFNIFSVAPDVEHDLKAK